MARRIWFDREDIGGSDTEVQFFANSQATHTSKKAGTNMEKDAELPRDFAVDRLGIRFPIYDQEGDQATLASLLADWQELLDGAVVEVEVAGGTDIIIPVSEMLLPATINAHYANAGTLAGDGVFEYVEELACKSGEGGAKVEFDIPAKTMFSLTLRLESALSAAMAEVKVFLFGDEAG